MSAEDGRERYRRMQVAAIAKHLADAHGMTHAKAAAVAACVGPWVDGSQAVPGCVVPPVTWHVNDARPRAAGDYVP